MQRENGTWYNSDHEPKMVATFIPDTLLRGQDVPFKGAVH